ncbi:MAG: ATP-binding protein [Candidatus Nanoarchaeia archaeon]
MASILKAWNPWWAEKSVSKEKKGIERTNILNELLKLIEAKEILVLTGVRRSGKSTLLYQTISKLIERKVNPENILYFNFDEPVAPNDANPIDFVYNSFLELNNPHGRKYVFFDEIQNIKEWERWIKKSYDLYGKDVKFILTGSNNSMLYDNLSKLLTGRILTKAIYPLSFEEFLIFNNVIVKDADMQKTEIKHFLLKYISCGGFPEAVLEESEEIRAKRLEEYFNSIILRDIVQPNNIREVAKLMELAKYLITNNACILSYNNISKAIGLNITSLKEYLLFLENAYLLFQLNFFSYSLKETIMIQKPRKIYNIDNGMRNAVGFKFSRDEGRLAENIVFIELKRKGNEMYFWKEKGEVDFIIKHKDNSLTAINASYTDKIGERETAALMEFKNSHKQAKKLIVITKDIEKKEGETEYIPLWKWLLQPN